MDIKEMRATRCAVVQGASETVGGLDKYGRVLSQIAAILDSARRASARAVNHIMTETYWRIGQIIIDYEQEGKKRAIYGDALMRYLSKELSARFGRGFSKKNLEQMRAFYLTWPITQTVSAQFNINKRSHSNPTERSTASDEFPALKSGTGPKEKVLAGPGGKRKLNAPFPLPWSHYVVLMSVHEQDPRLFYEAEALRGGWSVRQMKRQIASKFYERTLLSRNKAAMLEKGAIKRDADAVSAEEEIKDPLVLEFLDLKDEYSESELEEALIRRLESFLLEMGGEFTFVGRQRRLRLGNSWYRVDLVLFHRRLRCLVIIDLKASAFSHADVGQMHMYLNYARENWMMPGENPPVGLILCTERDDVVARYALDRLPDTVLAAEYKLALPDEELLKKELSRARRQFESRNG